MFPESFSEDSLQKVLWGFAPGIPPGISPKISPNIYSEPFFQEFPQGILNSNSSGDFLQEFPKKIFRWFLTEIFPGIHYRGFHQKIFSKNSSGNSSGSTRNSIGFSPYFVLDFLLRHISRNYPELLKYIIPWKCSRVPLGILLKLLRNIHFFVWPKSLWKLLKCPIIRKFLQPSSENSSRFFF